MIHDTIIQQQTLLMYVLTQRNFETQRNRQKTYRHSRYQNEVLNQSVP